MVDLSVTGGGITVRDFTPSAFKYDSSSFYNFEQDNLPIWDLEDRTGFNYYKLGASLSSLSGVTFTLSSASNTSANVFSDIADIIARLPKVVRFPVLIEIAKYGDLGELNLQGIKFENDGALLVRNLVYARADAADVITATPLGSWPNGTTRVVPTTVSSNSFSALPNAQTSNPNFSGITVHSDASLSANYRFLGQRVRGGVQYFYSVGMPDLFYLDISSSNFSRSTNTYNLSAYTNERDLSISSNDINIYWQNGYDTTRNLELDTTYFSYLLASQDIDAYIFGNYFSKVVVGHTGGNERSVILNGILVDAGLEYAELSSLEHSEDYGFYIQNSYVNMADCFAIRCRKSGFEVINSKINAVGSVAATRIYHPVYDTSLSTLIHSGTGTGLHLVNSQFTLPTSGSNLNRNMVSFSRCDQGIWAQNSVIDGGNQVNSSRNLYSTGADGVTNITVYHNKKDGVRLENSVIDFYGAFMSYSNGHNGFHAKDSSLGFTQYIVTHNFDTGIKLVNSQMTYGLSGVYPNPFSIEFYSFGTYAGSGTTQLVSYTCTHNNTNYHLIESSLAPYRKPGETQLPLRLGAMNHSVSWSYGATASGVGCNRPSIILDKSYGEFVHFFGGTIAGYGTNPGFIKGAICQARNGSVAKFIGTRQSATTAAGTANQTILTPAAGFHGTASNLQYFQRMAAFAALDNSKIEFSGPTKIFFFGVGVLAENNSVIRFGPQIEGDYVASEPWELSAAGNHTKVQLHSTRAGIVVKDHSKLIMEYLGDGDFTPHGGASNNFSDGLPYTSPAYVSGGYFQFLPNPYDEDMGSDDKYSLSLHLPSVNNRAGMLSASQVSATYGGMCVRAVGQSEVEINHVNFPMGIDPTLLSGAYYDLSTTCWWPFLWNIADDSRIIAKNIKVSGVTDGTHGYHGPSGLWAASGVPLDWYGASGPRQVANGDGTNYQNYGPFRFYFGIDPVYRNYVTTGATDNGMLIHSITQGYLPSGVTLSAIGGDGCTYRFNLEVSAASSKTILSSTVSSVLGGTGYTRNLLDETALNAWANARHCTEEHVKMIGVIKGAVDYEGEGSEHSAGNGVGIRSINVFDLGRKN